LEEFVKYYVEYKCNNSNNPGSSVSGFKLLLDFDEFKTELTEILKMHYPYINWMYQYKLGEKPEEAQQSLVECFRTETNAKNQLVEAAILNLVLKTPSLSTGGSQELGKTCASVYRMNKLLVNANPNNSQKLPGKEAIQQILSSDRYDWKLKVEKSLQYLLELLTLESKKLTTYGIPYLFETMKMIYSQWEAKDPSLIGHTSVEEIDTALFNQELTSDIILEMMKNNILAVIKS
jgi:hypothetical protein